MSKKQTSVEWLYSKIKSHFEHDGDLLESFMTTISIAKLKEREQIEEAYNEGYRESEIENYGDVKGKDISEYENASNYYTQTYGKCTPQS